MQITEKDLYYFVMHKDQLSDEKCSYIKANIDKFIEQITYLTELKENLINEVPQNVIKKINSRLDNKNSSIVILKPVATEADFGPNRLAAESLNKDIPKSYTLTDENKEYLIKINASKENSQIYLFSADKIKNNICSIKLYPSGNKYSLNIDEQPLIVDAENEIESLEISF